MRRARHGGRHTSSGEAALGRRGLAAARDLYGDALAVMQQRLPRRHPDYVACLINAALAHAALHPTAGSAPPGTLADCRRGVRAVRAAGGDASGLWKELERAVELGLAGPKEREKMEKSDPGGPVAGGPVAVGPVAVWTMRCGVGLADLAASLVRHGT